MALSVDLRVQAALEDELQHAAIDQGARGAVGIITNVRTGEVLGMASYPTYDPNRAGRATDYQRLNRAMAIRRSEYDYLLPSFAGEELRLGTWLIARDDRLIMERRFQLIRPADQATLLRGRWELICIEISSGRARRMPAEFEAAYRPAMRRLD